MAEALARDVSVADVLAVFEQEQRDSHLEFMVLALLAGQFAMAIEEARHGYGGVTGKEGHGAVEGARVYD